MEISLEKYFLMCCDFYSIVFYFRWAFSFQYHTLHNAVIAEFKGFVNISLETLVLIEIFHSRLFWGVGSLILFQLRITDIIGYSERKKTEAEKNA